MAAIYNQAIFNWIDINGKPMQNFLTTLNQGPGGAGVYAPLATAMQNCSHCGLVAIQFQTTVQVGNAATSGDYPNAFDRAAMQYTIPATGKSRRFEIPGPLTTILQPDRSLVNLASPEIVAVQTQVMALLGDTVGHPAGPFYYGTRQRARGQP